MNKAITRHAITGFLLLVFSLNTVLGFACGAGWNLGYNAAHHQQGKIAKPHSGTMHAEHHHAETYDQPMPDSTQDEDCCTQNVLKISLTDKFVPKFVDRVNPVYFFSFALPYRVIFPHAWMYLSGNSFSYLIPGHHPPITDIRIAIQRFQI